MKRFNKFIVYTTIILIVLAIVAIIFLKSQTCGDLCQEQNFNNSVDLGHFNIEGIKFYQKLESLSLKDNEEKEIEIKDLFEKEIKRIVLIERMHMDYSYINEKIKIDSILKNKEFCQIIIVEYKNNDIGYLMGRCEYDLMGYTKPYSKIGFDLEMNYQYLLPNDSIKVIFSPNEIERYSISSKKFKNLNF